MIKMNELEKKWYYYKIKNFLRSAIGFSTVVLLLLLAYYFYITQKNSAIKSKTMYLTNVLGVSKVVEPKTQDLNNLDKKNVLAQNISNKQMLSKKFEEVSLEPIIPVIDMEKEESIKHTKKPRIKRSRVTPEHRSKLVKAKPNSYLTAKELSQVSKVNNVQKIEPHVTKKMKFKTTSVNYIETMKKKYLKSKNARDAILISKAFYKKANYSKAEKWALSANQLDKNLDESWLFFAKSKAKLGKKQEAINILANYYKKSQSSKAKILIGQIKTGKL